MKSITYLTKRRYSIGVYADNMGYAVTLMQTNRVLIPYENSKQTFVAKSKGQYKEAEQYMLTKGIISKDRSEVGIRTICTAIEVMIADCENSQPVIYCNDSATLQKILEKQAYAGNVQVVKINAADAVFLINCLINDGVLKIANQSELLSRYNKALIDYTDFTEVNHALFSLALNLESFESGDSDWVKLLRNIGEAVIS